MIIRRWEILQDGIPGPRFFSLDTARRMARMATLGSIRSVHDGTHDARNLYQVRDRRTGDVESVNMRVEWRGQ